MTIFFPKLRILHRMPKEHFSSRLPALAAMMRVILALLAVTAGASATTAEPVRIMTYGDSLFHGYGLPADQSMSAKLEEWLNLNGWEAEVINASVSGETTRGGLERLDWTLGRDAATYPDLVIVELGANDMLRGRPAIQTRRNLDGIIRGIESRDIPVFIVGMRSFANYGAAYQEAFNAIYPDLAAEYDTGFHPYIYRAFQDLTPAARPDYFQMDGLHPNAKGVARLINDIAPEVSDYLESLGLSPDN